MKSKIFDPETVNFICDLGISKSEIDKLKLKELKEKSIQILRKVAELIKKEEFDKLEPYIRWSPSGDDMGCENHYINFGEIIGTESLDIEELFKMMNDLKSED